MGIVVSAVVGIVLTLPISSAAICAAMGISGGAVLTALGDGGVTIEVWNGLALAGGAATIGCCTHMLGFATLSFLTTDRGFVAQGLGTSMLQVPNLMKKPILWIPPVLTSMILGPIGTCVFQLRNNGAAVSSGMGPPAWSVRSASSPDGRRCRKDMRSERWTGSVFCFFASSFRSS